MTASIQEKNKRFYIVLNWTENRKRKQKWIKTDYTTDDINYKRKLEKQRREVLEEWQGKVSDNNDLLFSDYLIQWLDSIKHTISASTAQSYKQTINNSICPYFADNGMKLYDLKPYHIQDFYKYKMEHDGVSANTIHHYQANIHKALGDAVKMGRLKSNPADDISLPKKQKHISDYYTAEEMKTLLDNIKGSKIEIVIYLAAWFGLRRGEIIGLKWSNIDFANATLSITGVMKDKGGNGDKLRTMYYVPHPKTASSIRTFPMPESAVKILKELKRKQDERKSKMKFYNHEWDEFVCVRPTGDIIPLEYVSRTFPNICTKCGLKRLKLHELRHSNISILLESGASMKELQEWAGHSSYNTTANIYSHIQAKSKLRLSESLASIIG